MHVDRRDGLGSSGPWLSSFFIPLSIVEAAAAAGMGESGGVESFRGCDRFGVDLVVVSVFRESTSVGNIA
jgi:hypothetical protein